MMFSFSLRKWLAGLLGKEKHRPIRYHTRFRPQVEVLEDRLLLATFIVNSTGDENAKNALISELSTAGTVTLKSAIEHIQRVKPKGPNTIEFDIGNGVQRIETTGERLEP